MPVSPEDVLVEKEYPRTPQGVMDFIDDRLHAHIWRRGDEHRIDVPDGLARGTAYEAWREIAAAYIGLGWRVRISVAGLTAAELTCVTLYFTKE